MSSVLMSGRTLTTFSLILIACAMIFRKKPSVVSWFQRFMKVASLSDDQASINDLSDEILVHVLSSVDTETGVRTSVLAKRWRNVWKKVPNLDIDLSSYEESKTKAEFINRFLKDNPYRLDRMNLLCKNGADMKVVSSCCLWNMLERDCYESSLSFPRSLCIPETFFHKKSLVILELDNISLRLESPVSLPNVKIMRLKRFNPGESKNMDMLLSGLPRLETLSLDMDTSFDPVMRDIHICSMSVLRLFLNFGYFCPYNVMLNAPKLTEIAVEDKSQSSYSIKCVDSLVRAKVVIREDDESWFGLLEKISRAEEVICRILHNPFSSTPAAMVLPMLHRVKILTLISNMNGPSQAVHMLSFTPNLLTLVIKEEQDYRSVLCDWMPPMEIPVCLISSLKSVYIHCTTFETEKYLLETIAYILQEGQVMETVQVCHQRPSDVNKVKVNEFLCDLQALSKCSNCEMCQPFEKVNDQRNSDTNEE